MELGVSKEQGTHMQSEDKETKEPCIPTCELCFPGFFTYCQKKLFDFCSRSLGQQCTIWGSLETQASSWPGKGKVTHGWDCSIFLITSDTLKKYWAWHTPDTGQGAGQPHRWFWPSTKLDRVQGSTKESEARAGFFKRSKNQLQIYF